MLPRERVIETIRHGRPDRMPVHGWVKANLEEPITKAFGSVAAFEDKYEFDLAHLFGGGWYFTKEQYADMRRKGGGEVLPEFLLEHTPHDPNDRAMYEPVIAGIKHHKEQRGKFVYVQTPGIFECLNGSFGIENHLCHLLTYETQLHEVYRRQAEWNRIWAMNCLDLGVDMVHVSDDWGSQRSLLFSPDVWRRLIRPYHKITADAVKKRRAFLSLHCDGNFSSVIDETLALGYDVIHPWQESAGMSLDLFREKYRHRLTVMGGLDVQETIGFGNYERLKAEIERLVRMFKDGGLIFNTSHFVQAHCTIEELTYAFDLVHRLVRE